MVQITSTMSLLFSLAAFTKGTLPRKPKCLLGILGLAPACSSKALRRSVLLYTTQAVKGLNKDESSYSNMPATVMPAVQQISMKRACDYLGVQCMRSFLHRLVRLHSQILASTKRQHYRGSAEENEFHICVRVCGVEGRGKSRSGQFFFVCEKEDREESSTKSLGGMTRPKDEMGSQIVSSESDISYPILVYLSRNNNSQAQARRFPALTAPEPEFPVIFGSK